MASYYTFPAIAFSTDRRVVAHLSTAYDYAKAAQEACQANDPRAAYLCFQWAATMDKVAEINSGAARFFGQSMLKLYDDAEDSLFKKTARQTIQQFTLRM